MNRLDPILCYSTAGFGEYDVETALDRISEAGFTQVEISAAHGHLPADADLKGILSHLGSRGLQCQIVHAPAWKCILGVPEESWRKEAIGVLSQYVRIIADLGVSGAIMHPVPNPRFVSDPDTPELHERMLTSLRRSLDELVPMAEQAGGRILLENLPYSCDYPLLNLLELREFIEPYPAKALGLIIDVGHAQVSGHDPAEEIRAAGSRLCGTHLHDTDSIDDRHWVPGQGVIEWEAVLAALEDVGYTGLWTFEVVYGTNNETDKQLLQMSATVGEGWLKCRPR